jgi:hypothetical protein
VPSFGVCGFALECAALLWSVRLCFGTFVSSLWSVLVLIWEGHPWHSKNQSKIMLRVLFSHILLLE